MGYEVISGNVIPAVTGGVFDFVKTGILSVALLHSPAYILASYIIEQSIGSMTNPDDGSDWPLYISHMPDSSEIKTDCGALYDTSGIKDGRLMEGTVIQYHGIQFKIRSRLHDVGWSKVDTVAILLDAITDAEITLDGEDYKINNIRRTGPVISLGREPTSEGRDLFTANFLLTLKRII